MAKYCTYQWVDFSKDERLVGLWSLIGASVVFSKEVPNMYQQVFDTDPIAYDVLASIVKKNVNADKILVRQMCNGNCNMQSITDMHRVVKEAKNPQLIVHAGSNFLVILADAEYGMDVWILDVSSCY